MYGLGMNYLHVHINEVMCMSFERSHHASVRSGYADKTRHTVTQEIVFKELQE